MKNIKKIIVITLSILLVSTLSIIAYNLYSDKEVIMSNYINKNNGNGMLSLLIETGSSTGKYIESTSNTWPEGYVFNEKLSKCQNDSEITYDEENKQVKVSAIKSDICYVYFDAPLYHETCNDTTLACTIAKKYTTQGENNMYYHNEKIKATTANSTTGIKVGDVIDSGDKSYRYAGPSAETNNYVCFGSDATTCPSDNLYRIIGVFEVPIVDENGKLTNNTERRVKLIKASAANSSILGTDGDYSTDTTYHWNYSNGTNSENNWSESRLNKINLNTNYINYLNNINLKWSNMIANSIWYVGGLISYYVEEPSIPKFAYDFELGNYKDTSTPYEPINAKIGLMYLTDYYYAASPTYWSYPGWSASEANDYRAGKSSNWMSLGTSEWTISRHADSIYNAYLADFTGRQPSVFVNYSNSVRPSFYLKSSVEYDGGTGTSSNPYRVINTSYHETCNDTTLACTIAKKYIAQGENNMYYHNEKIKATTANSTTGVSVGDVIDSGDESYRYSGSSETTKNYVCFGSDATTCPSDNLYRIIGVFEVPVIDENGKLTNKTERRVKLIKASAANSTLLGTDGEYATDTTYHWNNLNGTNSNNYWSQSRLNKINLNTNYVNNLNKINTKWSNMIANSIWYVGGETFGNGTENKIKHSYNYELGLNKVITSPREPINAKIGLMYLTDYYYAASPKYWSYPGWNIDATKSYVAAAAEDWMCNGYNQWTISPCTTNDIVVAIINAEGNGNNDYASNAHSVRPAFYLKTSVKYDGGTGSSSDPYRIA